MEEKRCYTVTEIQEMLGLSRPVVYELINEKAFRALMIGNKYLISKKSFDAWLDGGIVEEEKNNTRGQKVLDF